MIDEAIPFSKEIASVFPFLQLPQNKIWAFPELEQNPTFQDGHNLISYQRIYSRQLSG
jgi:hypothetical protein